MDIESFQDELAYLFHPEPDEDGLLPNEHPHRRLTKTHLLDFAYMRQPSWEGASTHRYTRLCPPDHTALTVLMQNHGTPDRLFGAALRLMGDSIVAYQGNEDRLGEIRFYPPVVLTFWSGFETFVRYSSELLIATAQSLPAEVVRFLRDQEAEVRLNGEVVERTRHRSVLARYRVFLKYAYDYDVDSGSAWWQALERAKSLRDYYTHLDISKPRELAAEEVMTYLENVLLAIIVPSSHLQRTLMLGVYWLYQIWVTIHDALEPFTERPYFFGRDFSESYLFHCNFENVDRAIFPSLNEERQQTVSVASLADIKPYFGPDEE